jgi:2-alkyl-3-oxoalkanoate reductase
MLKVALVGANGFVGSRIVEMFHLAQLAEISPVVRSFASLAPLSKFKLDWQLADARDQEALTKAFQGCDTVIHCVSGDSPIIINSVAPVYLAAEAAGVRRTVYLSSAAVHGQAPEVGTDETSRLSKNQAIPYNNAKVKAEEILLSLRAKGKGEVVILRPGIVYGPRSNRWIKLIADELLQGKAYLIDDGRGICNSIYVDNLIRSIYLVLTSESKEIDGQTFLVGDNETVTWFDFYATLSSALGVDPMNIPHVTMPEFKRTWIDLLKDVRASRSVQKILPYVPERFKSKARASLLVDTQSKFVVSDQDGRTLIQKPTVSFEMALLQTCSYKLPHDKAAKLLKYQPVYSFDEGMQRSIGWLSFAGYSVSQQSR